MLRVIINGFQVQQIEGKDFPINTHAIIVINGAINLGVADIKRVYSKIELDVFEGFSIDDARVCTIISGSLSLGNFYIADFQDNVLTVWFEPSKEGINKAFKRACKKLTAPLRHFEVMVSE